MGGVGSSARAFDDMAGDVRKLIKSTLDNHKENMEEIKQVEQGTHTMTQQQVLFRQELMEVKEILTRGTDQFKSDLDRFGRSIAEISPILRVLKVSLPMKMKFKRYVI